ncbi:erythromycin esterase family protein [Myxococcota bacterium]|nr:erythromycin esterase family protein [Myxococcota bacterium]
MTCHPIRSLLHPRSLKRDELAPLAPLIEGARIIGLGEGAHFVSEFSRARVSLIRHLVEHHEFNAVGLECGAIQAARLSAWFHSPAQAQELERCADPLTLALYGSVLIELKSCLSGSDRELRLFGIDLPNTLNPQEDLLQLAETVRTVDPALLPEVEALTALLTPVDGQSALASTGRWGELDHPRQDEVLSRILRLRHRLEALAPVLRQPEAGTAFGHASGRARTVEYTLETLRVMNRLFSGLALDGDTSVRDAFMAGQVEGLMAEAPDLRLVVLAHNNHVQKTPVSFAGELTAVPMGQHLARRHDYRAIALTHLGDTVPEMDFPAPESPVGFAVVPLPADAPGPDSLEAFLRDAGALAHPCLALTRDMPAIRRVRSQSASIETEVSAAFDAVVCTPSAGKDPRVPF